MSRIHKNQEYGEISWEEELKNNSSINLANNLFKLSDYFKNNKINFADNYHTKGWSKKRKCLFPDHRENAASFFFNPNEEIFHCFGCNRGGKIVQFISYSENRKQIDVAIELLENNNIDLISSNVEFYSELEDEKLKLILLEFADYYYKFSENFNNENIKNVMLVFECYLKNNLFRKEISINELETRIKFIKNKLKEFLNV